MTPQGYKLLINLLKLIRKLYGIEGKFIYDESIVIEDPNLSSNLYYIAQEAVFNAAKYSGGTSICVKLKKEGDFLVLSIEDDGKGMQKNSFSDDEKGRGRGLKIMKYRAEIIDGNLQIMNKRPSGTIISVKIPIEILKDEGRIYYGGSYSKKQ